MSPPLFPSASSSSPVEVGSTMKLANVPVWFFLRRQDSKVRRFMSLVLGLALLLGTWQLASFQYHNNNNKESSSQAASTAFRSSEALEKGTKMKPVPKPTKPMDDANNNNIQQPANDKKGVSSSSSESDAATTKPPKAPGKNNKRTRPKPQEVILPPASSNNDNNVKFTLTDEDEFQPKIAWLMSWPNSGTSFTLAGVERLSNRSIATNYGDEVTSDGKYSLSIYPLRIEGPYWRGASYDEKFGKGRELPTNYVLTKTHCGGRCSSCGPKLYVETMRSFLHMCTSGHGRFPPRRQRHVVHYPPSRVHRAIQIIRNPFHNVVARFHLDRRNKARKPTKYDKWVAAHPENQKGFMRWCHDMNEEHEDEEELAFNVTKDDVWEVLEPIPCRAEFYMYIQWHNLLHESLAFMRQDRHVPLLTVHYEDYGKNLSGTFSTILQFLELEETGSFPEFTPRDDDYHNYFTTEQRTNIKTFLQHVASNTTWSQIQHYF